MTAIAMMAGRFGLAIPALVFAGLLGRQKERPQSRGTLRTDTFLFGALLTTFLIIVTALSYLPALTLTAGRGMCILLDSGLTSRTVVRDSGRTFVGSPLSRPDQNVGVNEHQCQRG